MIIKNRGQKIRFNLIFELMIIRIGKRMDI